MRAGQRCSPALLLAGCCQRLVVPSAQSQREAAYAAAAGAPVKSFRFFNLYSWEPLGDSQLVVYTRPNEAWLLEVRRLHRTCRSPTPSA